MPLSIGEKNYKLSSPVVYYSLYSTKAQSKPISWNLCAQKIWAGFRGSEGISTPITKSKPSMQHTITQIYTLGETQKKLETSHDIILDITQLHKPNWQYTKLTQDDNKANNVVTHSRNTVTNNIKCSPSLLHLLDYIFIHQSCYVINKSLNE